ncbi:MAG: hypothetical protein WBM46_20150 [Polyangiales bacterium]
MRTNLKSSSVANTADRPLAPTPEAAVAPSEPVPAAPQPTAAHPHGRAWPEDWNSPSKQSQMSAIWPLLWLTIPFVLLVLYGFFTRD